MVRVHRVCFVSKAEEKFPWVCDEWRDLQLKLTDFIVPGYCLILMYECGNNNRSKPVAHFHVASYTDVQRTNNAEMKGELGAPNCTNDNTFPTGYTQMITVTTG